MQARTSAELALWRSLWASVLHWRQQTLRTRIQAITGPRRLRPEHGPRRDTPTRRPRRRPGRAMLAPIRRAAGTVAIQVRVVRDRVMRPRILNHRSVPPLLGRPRERRKPTKARTPRTAVSRIHRRTQPGGKGIARRPPIPSRQLVGLAKVLRQRPLGPRRSPQGLQPAGRPPRGEAPRSAPPLSRLSPSLVPSPHRRVRHP